MLQKEYLESLRIERFSFIIVDMNMKCIHSEKKINLSSQKMIQNVWLTKNQKSCLILYI